MSNLPPSKKKKQTNKETRWRTARQNKVRKTEMAANSKELGIMEEGETEN